MDRTRNYFRALDLSLKQSIKKRKKKNTYFIIENDEYSRAHTRKIEKLKARTQNQEPNV
jgi:hypothetical protein